MDLGWLFLIYGAERLGEVWLARHNRRLMLAQGGREHPRDNYPVIVGLHILFWLSLVAESWPWRVPPDPLSLVCLLGLAGLMALRYWCIFTLGPRWNTRIIVLPDTAPVRRGPYRWLRHPNYLVVTLEFLLLPLLMRAPYTLVVFSLANLVVLRARIALEEEALQNASSTNRTAG